MGIDPDHGVAWFQIPFSVDITPTGHPMGDPSLLHTKERFGGIAVLGKDGWQLAVLMYARLIDDAQLAARVRSTAMRCRAAIRSSAATRASTAWSPAG